MDSSMVVSSFRARSICKPAHGALTLFVAEDPGDVVGTVSSCCRRLGNEAYPGDVRMSRQMAHRRTGLPHCPPPISAQHDLAATAAVDRRNGAPSLSPTPTPTPSPSPSPSPRPYPYP